ncbi:MAG: polysaccharide lyase family protein [Kiritimatiellae bacterium]|nr:polysaccharide lyase family protein [Kiritimatiellia bacterium]
MKLLTRKIILTAVLIVAWSACAALPDTIFKIGRADGSAAEFKLGQGTGWQQYAAEIKEPVVFTIGQSAVAESWPYIHPSVDDVWAGSRSHPFTLCFELAEQPSAPLFLIIEQLNSLKNPVIQIRVNGHAAGEQSAPNGSGDASGSAERGIRKAHATFEIEPALFLKGANKLEIALTKGSWLIYDCVRLCTVFPAELVVRDIREYAQELRAGKYGALEEIVFATRNDVNDGHWYANFGYYCDGPERVTYGTEGRLCVWNIQTGKLRLLVEDEGGTVRDPCVSYDGGRVLFSMRPPGDGHYHLYEINLDGSQLRQVTAGGYDDIEPCYLPDGGVAFCSGRAKRWVNCWLTQVATLYRCDLDPSAEELRAGGKNIRMLSSNIEQDNTPWPLPDGRLLYMRWEYIDRSQVHYHHLWTMNPDGTLHNVFFGNQHPGGLFIDAKPIPGSSDVIMIDSPGHGAEEHRGFLARVSAKQGPDQKSNLTRVSSGRDYRDPWAFSDDLFMVAKGRELVVMNNAGAESVIYQLPEEFKNCQLHEPRPVMPREREAVIADKTDPSKAVGVLFLEDIYEGRQMREVQRGTITKLMILESLPKPINFTGGMDPLSYVGTFTLPRVLGTVPVEEDGSANFEVPALRPVFFVALDKQGRAVKRMQSFTQVMPGEHQGCVGCHEERTRAPTPYSRGRGLAQAMLRQPSEIDAGDRSFDVPDFPKHVQPVLNRSCVRCHNPDDRKGGVDLSPDHGPMFSMGYYHLVAWGQVTDGRNYARSNYPPYALGSGGSPLMNKLDGSHHDVKVSAEDLRAVALWLDASAPYPGTYAALGCGSIGGYQQNNQVLNNDRDWPATQAAQPVHQRRCGSCHNKDFKKLPRYLSDENGLSFWQPDMSDPRIRFNRHVLFNLTAPEKSLYLRAPLSKESGGLGLCRQEPSQAAVFTAKDDPDYQTLLAMIKGGKGRLDQVKRFDMPGFKPRPEYIRELKRYGVLDEAFDVNTEPLDVYAIDRLYWDSF